MARVIMSASSSDSKAIEVTPEAINRFYVKPVELKWVTGEQSDMVRQFDVKIHASIEKTAPLQVTLTDGSESIVITRECDEETFARSMIEAIVTEHGDIDDVRVLKDMISSAAIEAATKLWETKGAIYNGACIDGFGFIEVNNDVVAVADCITCNEKGELLASRCTELSAYGNLGSGHLHFLPKGGRNFLVFDLNVTSNSHLLHRRDGEKEFILDTKVWPAPSKEVPASDIPKSLIEYGNLDIYLEAVTQYIQKHMGMGNDRRVELEDDLIF